MFAWRSAFFMAAMLLSLTAPCLAYAGTPLSERVAVEAGVRAEVNKDLAIPDKTDEALADRHCLDGRMFRVIWWNIGSILNAPIVVFVNHYRPKGKTAVCASLYGTGLQNSTVNHSKKP